MLGDKPIGYTAQLSLIGWHLQPLAKSALVPDLTEHQQLMCSSVLGLGTLRARPWAHGATTLAQKNVVWQSTTHLILSIGI
jgi:hypothetical protein